MTNDSDYAQMHHSKKKKMASNLPKVQKEMFCTLLTILHFVFLVLKI